MHRWTRSVNFVPKKDCKYLAKHECGIVHVLKITGFVFENNIECLKIADKIKYTFSYYKDAFHTIRDGIK